MTALLLLVIGLIIYGSLYPWAFDFHRAGNPVPILLHSWPRHLNRFVLRDIATNVLLYLPLGATAFLAASRRYSRAVALGAAVLLGVALSVSIELLQVYDARRDSSLLDVTTNTFGTVCGAAAALAGGASLQRFASRRSTAERPALALLLCWFVYQLYPFYPVLSRTRLRSALGSLITAGGFHFAEVWTIAAGWFVAGLLLHAFLEGSGSVVLALAMLSLPLRIFIAGRTPTINDFCGAALALILWPLVGEKTRLQTGLWMMLSALIVRELDPFRFAATPQSFLWIPFAGSLGAPRQPATIVLFGKVFYYGSAIWLVHMRRWPYAQATALIVAALAGLEWAQRYLPGRTPEITDPLLVLFMGLILWILEGTLRGKQKKRSSLVRRDDTPR